MECIGVSWRWNVCGDVCFLLTLKRMIIIFNIFFVSIGSNYRNLDCNYEQQTG